MRDASGGGSGAAAAASIAASILAAQGGQFRAMGGGTPGGLPVDFTPVMASVGTARQAAGARMPCKTPLVTTAPSQPRSRRPVCASSR